VSRRHFRTSSSIIPLLQYYYQQQQNQNVNTNKINMMRLKMGKKHKDKVSVSSHSPTTRHRHRHRHRRSLFRRRKDLNLPRCQMRIFRLSIRELEFVLFLVFVFRNLEFGLFTRFHIPYSIISSFNKFNLSKFRQTVMLLLLFR
jgi:hypothetical protein